MHVDVRTRRGRDLYEQHGVDAPVILRVVGHLRVLAPHHLTRGRHQAEVGAVHLDDRALGDHAWLGLGLGLGVHTDY